MSDEKIIKQGADASPEDFLTKAEFQKMAKESLAESKANLDEALKKLQVTNSAVNQEAVAKAAQRKSVNEWMLKYAHSDVRGMKKAVQDFVADTGTPEYAGNLVHPVFEEMIYRFTALMTPIYNDSKKITLRRGEGNTFNTQELVVDVVANWGDEGAMKDVTRLTIAQPNVTLDKLQGIVIMTDELRADAFVDFPTFVAERMARQMAIKLELGLLIGNGKNTDGLLNAVGVTFLNIGATIADFTYEDLLRGKIQYGIVSGAFGPGKAYLSWETYGNILLQKDNTGAFLIPNTNPSAVSPEGVTPAFLGQVPYAVSPQMPSTGLTAGDAVGLYTDLSQHSLVIEKEGLEVLYSQHASVTFTDDEDQETTVNAFQQDLTLGRFVRRVAGLAVNPSGLVVFRLGSESS